MTTIPDFATEHERASAAMMIQVRELAQTIDGFGFVGRSRRAAINPLAVVPDAFLEATAVACDAYPQLAIAGQVTGAALRDAISFGHAYINLANELRILAKGIEHTVAERRGAMGELALRVYAIAKRMNKGAERELLIPHVSEMRRTLGPSRTP